MFEMDFFLRYFESFSEYFIEKFHLASDEDLPMVYFMQNAVTQNHENG